MSREEEQQATEEPPCPRSLFVVSMMVSIKWALVLDGVESGVAFCRDPCSGLGALSMEQSKV
jgi:hypothetical protein